MQTGLDERYGLFINGDWVTPADATFMPATNPSNGALLSQFIDASASDVDHAVTAATAAFNDWKAVDVVTRSNMLLKIADLIDANCERLALIETLDNGKPIRETTTIDVPLSADHFRYFAGVIRTEEGSVKDFDNDTLSIVINEPIGVVGQIIPWNFPLLMAAWKLAPALAAGNTLVIKPSSATSLSLLELFKLMAEVLPAGVVNLITGSGSQSGQALLEHPGFAKLAFTGSTEVGYEVAKQAAKKLIPATLELGGKSANIFFDDMPFDRALEGAQLGILYNQGQVCCAGSRIFVQAGVYDRFITELKKAFEQVKVGLPWEKETQMGAQVNQRQLKKITDYIALGQAEGATLLTGGVTLAIDEQSNGAFLAPTLLTNVTPSMRIVREEIFGPVATVIKFDTIDEVIQLANDSDYGLSGGVWTTNLTTALKVGRGLQTGRVWVNTYNQVPAGSPFGGVKKSGIGRETHKMMLAAYTQTKNIYISTKTETEGLY